MQLQHIELGKLKVAAVNMRHSKQAPDVSDILPSVKARGVLVPLLVRPNGNGEDFEIVAGRRRYFAAKAVAEEAGAVEPLPCAVMEPGDDAAALEASLIENLARLDPDEMSQYETFVRLTKAGKSVADIAATFGITEVMVKRRLALGNLLPKIREAYRSEDIDAETIRHLTLATKAQQREWLKLFEDPEAYAPRAWQLKQWLFGGSEISTEAALFPLDAYKGHIVTDLFGEREYFADNDRFWTLQNEAIAAKRDALLTDGWTDVAILEPGERFSTWEHEKTPEKDGGRVYITVSHGGAVELHEGYLTRKEAVRKRKTREAEASNEPDTEARPTRPELSKAAQNYIELHRHAAVRHTLLSHPGVALRLVVATAIGGSTLWHVESDPQRAANEAIAENIASSRAETAFAEERKMVLKLLGLPGHGHGVVRANGDEHRVATLFAALLKLSDEDVLRALAFVMAETLEAGSALVEALGVHLDVRMADYWQPDETFLGLIRDKTVINAMLKQVAGKRVADGNVTATGKVQKTIIRDFLAGENDREKVEGWLPNYMGIPFKAYTKNGGIRVEDAWGKVKSLIKAA
jgi:ParB family chromosome partitioning protein